MTSRKITVVIPAAGRSSRSGLDFPKSLYKIGGEPILVRLCRSLSVYDSNPVIIINPSHQQQFETVLKEYGVNAKFIFQTDALGMGDALLKAETAVSDDSDVLLVWSDIPFLDKSTIRQLVNHHIVAENDFSLATSFCESCYTIVQRENGLLKAVIETRAAGIPPGKNGERDIGLFVFKKKPVFSLLKKQVEYAEVNGKKEQGFLYIIEKLVKKGFRAEGYPIAIQTDLLSFNTPEDLKEIEDYFNEQGRAVKK